MRQIVRDTVKAALRRVGLDVVRVRPDEKKKLLGLARSRIETVLDVGANTGQFARFAREVFPRATIHSYEPLPSAFRELADFAAREGGGRVHAYNVALGERQGIVPMWMKPDWNLSSSLLRSTDAMHTRWPITTKESRIEVELCTLDEHVAREGIRADRALLKLDVQGYEAQALRGGFETLRRAHACLLEVNLDALYEGQATFAELFEIFSRVDYRYAGNLEQSVAPDGHVIYLDALFLNNRPDSVPRSG